MPEQSDSQLLYHAKAGDLSAFGELWLRYHQLGIDYCRSLGGTDAEDLVSESFLRILLATKSTFGPTESFKGYLFATIRNDVSKKSKTSSIRELHFNPRNPSTVFAASKSGAVLLRSYDAGATWTKLTNGLPTSPDANRFSMDISPVDTNYVFLMATNSSSNMQGFYRSTDGGASFAQMSTTPNIPNGQGWYNLNLNVD